MNSRVRRALRGILTRAGIQVQVFSSGKFIPIPLWDHDPVFSSLWKQVEHHTLVDKRRCFMLYQFARQAYTIAGNAAEVGVYRGGTARLLAKALDRSGRTFHLFDTFTGMPTVDPTKDIHMAGDFKDTSLDAVKAYLFDCPNVFLHAGLFPETAGPIEDMIFNFVHIDVDIYQSVMDCCQFFYSRLTPGGIMIFDDYGMITCPGAKLAIDTFFADKSEYPCYLPTGQAVVIRI